MGYICISKANGWFTIHVTENGVTYPEQRYLYYSKREAIKLYREKYNLKNKKLKEIII